MEICGIAANRKLSNGLREMTRNMILPIERN
jgi:hypothetical protein